MTKFALALLGLLMSCGAPVASKDGGSGGPGGPHEHDDSGVGFDDGGLHRGDAGVSSDDAGLHLQDAGVAADAGESLDPWADRVVAVQYGPGAGFGQDRLPNVVLGPPQGGGASTGSLDVLSLGLLGSIDLEFTDWVAIDGPGVDLLVFENPFGTFFETGVVSVSDDGVTWREFPCDATDGGVGCAGTRHVFANPGAGISGTDPLQAGGDGFDLAEVGLTRARFVRVRDSGANRFYGAPGGGFDLDGVAVVNGQRPDGGGP
jgi:hypothetical protein